MKLGKKLGRIGFVVGFVGAFLFYASPAGWFTYESHVLCPLCPYIDIAFGTRLMWVQIGLQAGLLWGILYAVAGFLIGIGISKARRKSTPADNLSG